MRTAMVLGLFLMTAFAGCLDDAGEANQSNDQESYPYAEGDYVMEGEWSVPLQPALYEFGLQSKIWVPVADGTQISLGLFFPDIPGCDWNEADLPAECQLPIVLSASPYYLDTIGEPSGRPPLPEWLVPRGFIVVQMALRGSGESEGCMGFKDPKDADDISDIVDWLVSNEWSNGNVGVGGRSYVGTSAWAAAASGNPHVKTIMPISGAVNGPQLYFRNGTNEVRVLAPHLATYWALYAMGAGAGDPTYRVEDWGGNVCPEAAESQVEGPAAVFTGDASSEYWQARILNDDILANYEGSAWVIHGMTDWNVDPSQAVPFVNDMIDAGIPTRAWLGQWAHAYPDNTIEHWNTRWDWSTQVVDWFEYWLRDDGPEPILGIEIEDDTYRWRHEDRYPPVADDVATGMLPGGLLAAGQPVTHTWTPETDLHIAGLIQLELEIDPVTGGQIFAELFDDTQNKRMGWGALDIRHHKGGNTDPALIVPGERLTVRIQFEPADSVVTAGDTLRLVLSRDGVEDLAPDTNPSPMDVVVGTIFMPLVERESFIPIPLPEGDRRAAAPE